MCSSVFAHFGSVGGRKRALVFGVEQHSERSQVSHIRTEMFRRRIFHGKNIFTMFGKRFWKNGKYFKKLLIINSFWATGFFLYPLKTSENFWFSDVFLGVYKGTSGMKWVKASIWSWRFNIMCNMEIYGILRLGFHHGLT